LASVLEKATERRDLEEAIRAKIAAKDYIRLPDGAYRFELAGIAHIRGEEYVERMIEWNR
jgi:excinuclease UvrABC nuclease subunit